VFFANTKVFFGVVRNPSDFYKEHSGKQDAYEVVLKEVLIRLRSPWYADCIKLHQAVRGLHLSKSSSSSRSKCYKQVRNSMEPMDTIIRGMGFILQFAQAF